LLYNVLKNNVSIYIKNKYIISYSSKKLSERTIFLVFFSSEGNLNFLLFVGVITYLKESPSILGVAILFISTSIWES
jgi:hypothetical protein